MVMIDRVARAIYASAPAWLVTGDRVGTPIAWDNAEEDTRASYRGMAIAALLPLRDDPDGELFDVGGATIDQMRNAIPATPGKVLAGHAFSAMMTKAIG
ncbi:hypothetical protein SPHINGO391_500232 [Sphingomonas aurantiaca]|uniref:Uncharacterized protein n=1 Tax=Sphingomonas aurantiaca TaxID=185949 RepID=A0A5E8AB76_9SPHN|nr:hypothetical protein [Sphingomonas aurantiaca]VVT28642.1 hypothetical protein SPHINGO391_500232 [Sphingomonas aurantiaca]